ncbi:MAG: TlpA family protein disulfide reductase [Methylococcales bacterium]|jgi:peroxiredoxin|nr:TlpA family protein disulfide reductase [Methylococcales bacterium]MBT7410420.1 TlpA family protein disulfide reductase [Methylococcales bacterium]
MKNLISVITCIVILSIQSTVYAVSVGERAPIFNLTTFESEKRINLSDYRGKVILLDFWASWCTSCRQAFPVLNSFHHQFKAKDFKILAINVDEDPKDGKHFLRRYSADFTVLSDPLAITPEKYQLKAMPMSFIIDRDGIVRKVKVGFKVTDKISLYRDIKMMIKE